ncbi:nose resistant to fluoxetine protein 6-like [Haemaphysalis longicornis]
MLASLLPLFIVTLFFNQVYTYSVEVTTKDIEEGIDAVIASAVKSALPYASELMYKVEVSSECSSGFLKLVTSLRRQEPWAMKMILANALLPNNLFEYGVSNIGGFEQCLRTVEPESNGAKTLKGQYCTMTLRITKKYAKKLGERFRTLGDLQGRFDLYALPDKIRGRDYAFLLGICAPSTCSQDELGLLIDAAASTYGLNTTVKGCRTRTTKSVSPSQATSICILGLLVTLVITGTTLDILLGKSSRSEETRVHGMPVQILLAFSAKRNAKRLMSTHIRPGNEYLQFVNGMKTLMCCWVILGHTYIIMQIEYYHSLRRLTQIMEQLHFQVVMSAPLSVSTFFFMSGFLLAYIMQAKRQLARRQNPIAVYLMGTFRRYVRLICPAVVVVLVALLLPLMLEGPGDDGMFVEQISGCSKNWWTLLLLVNNFKRIEEACLIHLWYIPVDMQVIMFVALPLAIVMIHRPRYAMGLGVLLSILSCVVTGYLTYRWDLLYSLTIGTSDIGRILDTTEYIYFKPYSHVATYIAGMLCGYLTRRYKNVQISKPLQGAAWMVSLVLSLSVIYVSTPWNRGHLPTRMATAVYAGLHRIVWCLSLWWLHHACATGRGGWINSLLSSRVFQILGRLVYGSYLVHLPLLLVRIGITKTPLQAEEFFQTLEFIGITVLSMVFACLLNIICESPIDQLDRLAFRHIDKQLMAELNSTSSKKPTHPEVLENNRENHLENNHENHHENHHEKSHL